MKIKKSKHVHQDRGYTPVVNCKLTSRRLVCCTETDIQGVAVAVAHPQKVDIEQMAHDISHATTATPTDVKLVWDALRTVITDALSHGHRVQLDGLGSLTMELSSHSGDTPPTGKDIRISGIRFRPDKHLLDRLADVKFKVEGKVSQSLSASELTDALYEYFEIHDAITTKEFARISHYAMSTSYRKIAEYVAQGKMERVPRTDGYYRPTSGNFGRE